MTPTETEAFRVNLFEPWYRSKRGTQADWELGLLGDGTYRLGKAQELFECSILFYQAGRADQLATPERSTDDHSKGPLSDSYPKTGLLDVAYEVVGMSDADEELFRRLRGIDEKHNQGIH